MKTPGPALEEGFLGGGGHLKVILPPPLEKLRIIIRIWTYVPKISLHDGQIKPSNGPR